MAEGVPFKSGLLKTWLSRSIEFPTIYLKER
jgi:hypothetical protein